MIFQYLPPEVGLLQPVLNLLIDWCHVLPSFPVVTWSSFVEYIRSHVNVLASEDHCRELLNQLVVVGEVYLFYFFIYFFNYFILYQLYLLNCSSQ